MTSKGHKKHARLSRPDLGKYGRFELALIGAPCSVIRQMVEDIAARMSEQQITYIDADHQTSERAPYHSVTDRINYHQISTHHLSQWDQRLLLDQSDIVLVNGNHFSARRQIVFCTEEKRASLSQKMDRLSSVDLVLLEDGIDEPFDFLNEVIRPETSIISMGDVAAICDWISEAYQDQVPQVKGLVLAGGKSQRMGTSKAQLRYHGDVEQVYFAAQQLATAGIDPYISCTESSAESFTDSYPLIHDTIVGLGPFGAILSAFRQDPNAAWVTIACDQPLLRSEHLSYLLEQRSPSQLATCYHNPETGFPEPLITLWEPKAYPHMLQFLAQGNSCPRKVLINSDIRELSVDDVSFMKNANTPDEREEIQRLLSVE